MVRTTQYKFIQNQQNRTQRGGGEPELYDLIKDPLETNDLAKDPAHAATVKDLSAQLETWQQNLPPVPIIEGVTLQATGDTPPPLERKKKDRQRKKASTP